MLGGGAPQRLAHRAVALQEGHRHVARQLVDGTAQRAALLLLAVLDELGGQRGHRPRGQASPRQDEHDDQPGVIRAGEPDGVAQGVPGGRRAVEADENPPCHARKLGVDALSSQP